MKTDPYKKLSGYYDKFVEPTNRILRKIMLKMLRPEKGMKILEVGCGTGTNLQLFLQKGCKVYGIDTSPSMLETAKTKLHEKAELILGDASNMSYPENNFDTVVAMLTLHEMPEKVRISVFNEMIRVVKNDGQIMIVDFHPGPIEFPKGWYYKTVILFFERVAGKEHFKNYREFLAGKGLPSLIEQNNLKVVKEKIVGGGNMMLALVKK